MANLCISDPTGSVSCLKGLIAGVTLDNNPPFLVASEKSPPRKWWSRTEFGCCGLTTSGSTAAMTNGPGDETPATLKTGSPATAKSPIEASGILGHKTGRTIAEQLFPGVDRDWSADGSGEGYLKKCSRVEADGEVLRDLNNTIMSSLTRTKTGITNIGPQEGILDNLQVGILSTSGEGDKA